MTLGQCPILWRAGVQSEGVNLDWGNVDGHGRLSYLGSPDSSSPCDLVAKRYAFDGPGSDEVRGWL
jgi:hypothetical protein